MEENRRLRRVESMTSRIITIKEPERQSKLISHSAAETHAFAKRLLVTLHGGNVLSLSGNLGAGKTTFVQGLGKAAGIKEHVTSPTFVLMKIYALKKPINGIEQLCHIDAYRLESGAELAAIGAEEYIGDAHTLTVIEWPERVQELIPRDSIRITFKHD